jgi:hypothetical protein
VVDLQVVSLYSNDLKTWAGLVLGLAVQLLQGLTAALDRKHACTLAGGLNVSPQG